MRVTQGLSHPLCSPACVSKQPSSSMFIAWPCIFCKRVQCTAIPDSVRLQQYHERSGPKSHACGIRRPSPDPHIRTAHSVSWRYAPGSKLPPTPSTCTLPVTVDRECSMSGVVTWFVVAWWVGFLVGDPGPLPDMGVLVGWSTRLQIHASLESPSPSHMEWGTMSSPATGPRKDQH